MIYIKGFTLYKPFKDVMYENRIHAKNIIYRSISTIVCVFVYTFLTDNAYTTVAICSRICLKLVLNKIQAFRSVLCLRFYSVSV